MENPFKVLVPKWMEKIRQGMDFKRTEFQNDADECYRFFDGTYEFMYNMRQQGKGFIWTGEESDTPKPAFAMTLNKVAEFVQIFGPVLYHRNPDRTVNPRKVPDVPVELFQGLVNPSDPAGAMQAQMQVQQMLMQVQESQLIDTVRAGVMQHYLNYTPEALDLKTEMRWAIDEALVKGMGLLWTQPYTSPGGQTKMAGSFFDSVDNLCLDPDPKLMRECKWIAQRQVIPTWEAEEKYGWPRGSLKGHFESGDSSATAATDPQGHYLRATGKTNDLMVIWHIYSKMGLGARLAGVDPQFRDMMDSFGNWTYLCLCDTMPTPLNLPDSMFAGPDVQANTQALQKALEWPTPYWADGEWPFTTIIFHERPNKLWPMSHIKPALGELKFLNWGYSFLASKIRITCRDFIAMRKSAGEELKSTILHGKDLELLEIDAQHGGAISEIVQFLQHPEINGDIWKVLEAIEVNFEKRIGLTELMYGTSSRQLRSAQEANLKSSQIQIRPDDMAAKVEESASAMSRKEAFCARWHLIGKDVAQVLGPAGEQVWDMLITAANPAELLYSLEYRIEAGSAKKPNKESLQANMTQAIQTLFQPLFQYAQATGNVNPINALISQWADANDFSAAAFLLPAPPPPPPAPAGPGGKGPPQNAPTNGQAARPGVPA